MQLNYQFAHTSFGTVLVATSAKGVAHLSFVPTERAGLTELQKRFPNAVLNKKSDVLQKRALGALTKQTKVPLDLHGTPFQLHVWEALLKIPHGMVTTYGDIARHLGMPTASRAVGTAVGRNPVAVLVPCHRVISANGTFGNYHWGRERKVAILAREAA